MTQAQGFWIKDCLIWQINGEFVSDRALRSWCWHNVKGVMRHVDVIRQIHTDAYANRNQT